MMTRRDVLTDPDAVPEPVKMMFHFAAVGDDGVPRLLYGDKRVVEVGRMLTVPPPVSLCSWGLHASPLILYALAYRRQGSALCRVTLWGATEEGEDKSCSTERHCHAMVDGKTADERLAQFSFWCALRVTHLWPVSTAVIVALQNESEETAVLDEYRGGRAGFSDLNYVAYTAALAAIDRRIYDNAPYAASLNAIRAISRNAAFDGARYQDAQRKERDVHEAKLRSLFPEVCQEIK